MLRALLRSGNLKDYTVLGQDGITVHSVASQLRNTIKLKRGKVFADYLAIPQSNEQGSQIDWYVPFDSTNPDGKYFIIPWSAATDEERAQALVKLQLFEHSMLELGQEIGAVSGVKGDQRLFSRLLCSTGSFDLDNGANLTALRFPSADYVYIVNDQPVITFWGFTEKNAQVKGSPFLPLRPAAALIPQSNELPLEENIKTIPIATKHSGCKRFWWILPLLFALALLLFFLRGCAPSLGLPSLNLPSLNLPSLGSSEPKVVDDITDEAKTDEPLTELEPKNNIIFNGQKYRFSNGKWFDADGGEILDKGLLDNLNALLPSLGNFADNQTDPLEENLEDANSQPTTPEPTNPEAVSEPLNPPESANENGSDNTNNLAPNNLAPSSAQQKTDNKLNIPPKSLKNGGSVDFLNGNWNAGAGIQDKTTGKPLRLNYQFKNGKGEVRLNRGDGVECIGDVNADINNGGLNIKNIGTAKCTDGSSYQLPQVRCNGSAGDTDCKGEYQQGNTFPMSIKHN